MSSRYHFIKEYQKLKAEIDKPIEHTGDQRLSAYLLEERQKVEIKNQKTVRRVSLAFNGGFIHEDERVRKETEIRIGGLEQKLHSFETNEIIPVKPELQADRIKVETKSANNTLDEGTPNIQTTRNLVEVLNTFKELSDEVCIISSVQRHFPVLLATSQYDQLTQEFENKKISNEEKIPLDQMQKEMDGVFSDLLEKKKSLVKHSIIELHEYIHKWSVMECVRSKKISELLAKKNGTTDQKTNQRELEKLLQEGAVKIKADWCKIRFEQFIHSFIGRELQKYLDNVFGSQKIDDKHANSGLQSASNYSSVPIDAKTAILKYLAGSIDEIELQTHLRQDIFIDINKIVALRQCLYKVAHVCLCKLNI